MTDGSWAVILDTGGARSSDGFPAMVQGYYMHEQDAKAAFDELSSRYAGNVVSMVRVHQLKPEVAIERAQAMQELADEARGLGMMNIRSLTHL